MTPISLEDFCNQCSILQTIREETTSLSNCLDSLNNEGGLSEINEVNVSKTTTRIYNTAKKVHDLFVKVVENHNNFHKKLRELNDGEKDARTAIVNQWKNEEAFSSQLVNPEEQEKAMWDRYSPIWLHKHLDISFSENKSLQNLQELAKDLNKVWTKVYNDMNCCENVLKSRFQDHSSKVSNEASTLQSLHSKLGEGETLSESNRIKLENKLEEYKALEEKNELFMKARCDLDEKMEKITTLHENYQSQLEDIMQRQPLTDEAVLDDWKKKYDEHNEFINEALKLYEESQSSTVGIDETD